MIHIDFTNDAPMIETVEGEGFIRIDTAATADQDDSVLFQPDESSERSQVPVSATATQRVTIRTPSGANVIELQVKERDLPDYGLYEIRCITRRRQVRDYIFAVLKGAEEGQVSFSIDPKTTPCAWVTEADVHHTSKTEKTIIPAQL